MSNISLETPSQQRAHSQKRWHERHGILDLSRSGMCVAIPYRLEFRSFIHVHAPNLKLNGTATIRHQKPEGLNYVTGLEFVGGLVFEPPVTT
jgi:hypothetical protein